MFIHSQGRASGLLLSRRQILIAAGATVRFGGLGTWAAADDHLKLVPREFPEPPPDFPGCGNIPTGGPFYPQAPGAGDLRTKAGFDRDRVWPIGQEVVV